MFSLVDSPRSFSPSNWVISVTATPVYSVQHSMAGTVCSACISHLLNEISTLISVLVVLTLFHRIKEIYVSPLISFEKINYKSLKCLTRGSSSPHFQILSKDLCVFCSPLLTFDYLRLFVMEGEEKDSFTMKVWEAQAQLQFNSRCTKFKVWFWIFWFVLQW